MKTISNKVRIFSASISAVVLSVFLVAPTFAVDNPAPQNKMETSSSACSKLKTFSIAGRQAVAEKRTDLQTDFSKRLASVSTKQTDIDKKINDGRIAATTKFEEKIKSLEEREGLTTEQQTAIDTFKTGVEAAQLTRKTAVDDARSTYRNGLATLIATNQQTLSNAVTTYQTNVTSALTTATTNCTDANAAAITATLKASLKSAREGLAAKQNPDTNQAAIKALATTRDAAIKSANETFRTTIKTLADTLKAALQTATDTTTN